MNHTSEHVLAFSDELRQILSVLSEHLNLHVRNADLIHKGTMDLIERLLTASEAIDEKYRELNMAPGNPMSPVEYGAKGGFYRRYEHGAIYYHPQIGAFRVYGAIYQKYLQLGAEAGFLGYPTTDETGASDNIGRYNHFQGGSIYWTSTTGAREIHGVIRAKWASMGWENSYLGYPTSDEEDWIDPSGQAPGRISHFQRGTIVFWWTTGNAADLPDIAADAAYWQEPISPDSTGPWLASVQVVGYPEPNGRRFALAGSNCQPGNPQRKVRLRLKNRPSWVSQATFLYETEFVVYPNGAFDLSTQIFIPSTAGKLYFAVRDAVGWSNTREAGG